MQLLKEEQQKEEQQQDEQQQQDQQDPQQQEESEIPLTTSTTNHNDEQLIYQVLDEIDNERSLQVDLEKELRQLQSEAAAVEEESSMALMAMELDRDCFREIVDALTETTQAVPKALMNDDAFQPQPLPIHVVRMLEYTPHDPRAVQCTKAKDEIYECQWYEAGEWKQNLADFPDSVQNLPIAQTENIDTTTPNNSKSSMIQQDESEFSGQMPPKHCVLTNKSMTKRFPWNEDGEFHLPQNFGGTWEWVSGWLIDKSPVMITTNGESDESKKIRPRRNIRDPDGWCYASEPKHFAWQKHLCGDDPLVDDTTSHAKRPWRRRRWTRQRALRSYPYASKKTLEYLRLSAENSRLSVTRTNVSESLIEMKTKLTEMEEALDSTREDTIQRRVERQRLEKEIIETDAAVTSMKMKSSKQETMYHRELSKQRAKVEELRKQLEKTDTKPSTRRQST